MERIRVTLQFDTCISVNPMGRSGGIALFWLNANEVEIVNYFHFHIHAKLYDADAKLKGFLKGFRDSMAIRIVVRGIYLGNYYQVLIL